MHIHTLKCLHLFISLSLLLLIIDCTLFFLKKKKGFISRPFMNVDNSSKVIRLLLFQLIIFCYVKKAT